MGRLATVIHKYSHGTITDDFQRTIEGWMDARDCLHLTCVDMTDDELTPIDGQMFASVCVICDRATVLHVDEQQKFYTMEHSPHGFETRSPPTQLDERTCRYMRQLVLNSAGSAVHGFDDVYPSSDHAIDVERFYRRWDGALTMMGWLPAAPVSLSTFREDPRLDVLLSAGILCTICADIGVIEIVNNEMQFLLHPIS